MGERIESFVTKEQIVGLPMNAFAFKVSLPVQRHRFGGKQYFDTYRKPRNVALANRIIKALMELRCLR